MADLTKGLLEIDGYSIGQDTLSTDIENSSAKAYANRAISKNGKVEIYTFHNIEIQKRIFDIDLTFIHRRLSEIELYSCHEGISSYEDRFRADREWLENILGKPTEVGKYGIIYKFETVSIGASWRESDGRSGPDGCISIRY